jgi:hypothetical protein
MRDENFHANGSLSPAVAGALDPVLDRDDRWWARVGLVRLLGHSVALLPVAAFFFMRWWLGQELDDANRNVIGPAWYIRWGGQDTAQVLVPLCLIGGIGSIVAGFVTRRWVTVCEGVWACAAVPFLLFVFMAMTS